MANAKRKNRKKVLIGSGLGLLLVGLALFALLRPREVVLTVQSEKVARRNVTEVVEATGKIQPVVFVKISPEVSGEIIELPVKEGQAIQKGDLLLKIKPDFYQANRNSAEAGLKSALASGSLAQAQWEKAQAEYRRSQQLFESRLISDSQLLDGKTAFDIATASSQQSSHQVEMSRAVLARAEDDLAKTTIRSPLAGTISKLNSQKGERVVGTATYQGTEVMTIADLSLMEARVDIGEMDVVLIDIGQKAQLEVDSFRDRKFHGAVSEIANTAKTSGLGSQQEATKFEVRIRIQEREPFRPGMSVTAAIETRSRTNVLTVPTLSVTTRTPKEPDPKKAGAATNRVAAAASRPEPAATNVASTNAPGRKTKETPKPIEVIFLIENGQAKMRPVTRGISDDSYTEILAGVAENQEVVSGGYKAINRELEDGKRVRVDQTRRELGPGDRKEAAK